MSNLYVIDYPVPFPRSEYGGIVGISASNPAEALMILKEFVKDDAIDYPDTIKHSVKAVDDAQVFYDCCNESKIQFHFTT